MIVDAKRQKVENRKSNEKIQKRLKKHKTLIKEKLKIQKKLKNKKARLGRKKIFLFRQADKTTYIGKIANTEV